MPLRRPGILCGCDAVVSQKEAVASQYSVKTQSASAGGIYSVACVRPLLS